MTFRELGLMGPILKALEKEGYTTPTPIQQGAIPPALKGRDVLGCAQTGTGKTCAFAAPILQRLHQRKVETRVIRALILTPTRELAIQIGDSFKAYGANLPLRHTVIFGGVGQQPQVDAIRRGLDILVATPGRLLDLHGQGLLDLSHIEIFVLDEADRMLDMGFIHDVKRVIKLLPQKKQTLFFSATMPPEVMDLVNSLLRNYARVEVDPVSSPVEVIRQSLYFVDKANKTHLLAYLLEEMNIPSALVFSRTKHGANRIAQDLSKRGISAAAIHGNKSQTARVQALNDFKAGNVRVLAATDIAARGIDIEELSHVFNYNLPDVPETYVHRIGRTGRAGHDGVAISFCQFDEQGDLKAIEKLLGRPIPVVDDHPFPMVNFEMPKKDKNGRPVNAEDAEARAAAKERRRQRDAENKAKAETRKLAAAQKAAETLVSFPVSVEKSAESAENSGKKRKKKKKPVEKVGTPTENISETTKKPMKERPGQETKQPLKKQTTGAESVRTEEKPANRGVRQGRLADTMPTDPAMPVVDFVKPNPLDSDVIMDATARLLAPRRPIKPVVMETAPKKQEQKKAEPKKPEQKKQVKKASPAPKQEKKAAPVPQKEEPKPQQAPAKKKNKRKKSTAPRSVESAPRSDRQKDSTQYKSRMKPYYISHED